MAPIKRKPGTLKNKIEIAKDFDDELDLIPVGEKSEGELLTVAEQNEVMVRALREIFDIYMVFDDPKAADFGLIAQRALKKVGRL